MLLRNTPLSWINVTSGPSVRANSRQYSAFGLFERHNRAHTSTRVIHEMDGKRKVALQPEPQHIGLTDQFTADARQVASRIGNRQPLSEFEKLAHDFTVARS
jgi:hypothetical protein